jgi:transcriptional regulator with XRE-family HTH domain
MLIASSDDIVSASATLMSTAFVDIIIGMITSDQCRMARAALKWNLRDLADRSKVSHVTINRFEMGQASSNPSTLAALRQAMEAAGVIFIDQNGEGPGVRLRKSAGTGHADASGMTTATPSPRRSVGPEDEDRAGPEAPED